MKTKFLLYFGTISLVANGSSIFYFKRVNARFRITSIEISEFELYNLQMKDILQMQK